MQITSVTVCVCEDPLCEGPVPDDTVDPSLTWLDIVLFSIMFCTAVGSLQTF